MLADAPFAFSASPDQDVKCDVAAVRGRLGAGDADVIFGAFAPRLIGSLGVAREPERKSAHKAFVWGMYVAPRHRRRGLGRRLLETALAHARTLDGACQVHLVVSEQTPGARALYEAVGFRRWGTEPRAVGYEGRFADEHHMVLLLDEPAASGKKHGVT